MLQIYLLKVKTTLENKMMTIKLEKLGWWQICKASKKNWRLMHGC